MTFLGGLGRHKKRDSEAGASADTAGENEVQRVESAQATGKAGASTEALSASSAHNAGGLHGNSQQPRPGSERPACGTVVSGGSGEVHLHSSGSESVDSSRRPNQKEQPLYHKAKVFVKAGGVAKVHKADHSLLESQEALQSLKSIFNGIASIIRKNDAAYGALAESQRSFVATVSSVYSDTDNVLAVISETNTASDAVKGMVTPGSELDNLRKEVERTLSELEQRLSKLMDLHKFRENQAKEYVYFSLKFSALEETAFKKSSAGTSNTKGMERLARNENKLREVTSVLNSVTDQFYMDLEVLFRDRALFVDKFVRCFVLQQSELLVPFCNMPRSLNVIEVGNRTNMETVSAPKHPQPVSVQVSYVPSENPQLRPYGQPEGGVSQPFQTVPQDSGHAQPSPAGGPVGNGSFVSLPAPPNATSPTQRVRADGHTIYQSYNTPQSPAPYYQVGGTNPTGQRPTLSGYPPFVSAASPAPSAVWGIAPEESASATGATYEPPGSSSYRPSGSSYPVPPAPAPPHPVSDSYIPVPPPPPSYLRSA